MYTQLENSAFDSEENWIKWNPLNMPEGKFIVTSLIQNADGTKIILDDEKTNVEIFFDGITPIVRSSVEGIRMRTWGEIQLRNSDKYFFRNWFLYQVKNSKLSKWAVEESCGFYEEEKLTHFSIVTSEEIIDVLATFFPTISVSEL